MERRSNKHGTRVDDELKHEVSSLVRGSPDDGRTEGRSSEASSWEEGGIGHRPEVDDATANNLTQDELDHREEIARHLRPSIFPATRSELLETLNAEGAPDAIVAEVEGLPDDEPYQNVQDIWRSLGQLTEHRD